jgi:hypothetical protein
MDRYLWQVKKNSCSLHLSSGFYIGEHV